MLCWWKIWLLSTSAFLNTHSYLPSPQEERSFLFSFLLCIAVLSSPHFYFPLLLQPFLLSHLSTPHLSFYILPLWLLSFFFASILLLLLFHSTLLLSIPSFLVVSCALCGTAHSATKQSCLQHHTLANQARLEFSCPQQHHDTGQHWRERFLT